jgi:transposase
MLDSNIKVPMPAKGISIKTNNYVYLILKGYRNKYGKPTSDSVAIGKKDFETGMLIPNHKYYDYFQKQLVEPLQTKPTTKEVSKVCRIGCSTILDHIGKEIGLLDIVQQVFPDNWDKIMTVAFYMATESNVMYFIDDWLEEVKPPYDVTLESKTCSELFSSISFSQRDDFFSKWINSRMDLEHIAYDVTSISTTASGIDQAEHGYNRDLEKLPQVNIGMFYGENSRLPVFYNLYNGSIVDKEHLIFMMENTKRYNILCVRFVMDAGFVTKENLAYMSDNKLPFLVSLPVSRLDAKKIIDKYRNDVIRVSNRINRYETYGIEVDYVFEGLPLKAYLYYSAEKFADDEKKLHSNIEKSEEELKKLLNSKRATSKYKAYFDVITNGSPGTISYEKNIEKIEKAQSYLGYFVFLSSPNFANNTEEIISLYRNRDVVEKSFDDLKNGMDFHRLRTHYTKTTEGKIFISFIALIIRAWMLLKKNGSNMQKLSLQKYFREINKISQVEYSDGQRVLCPLTKKQKIILDNLNIPLEIFES